MSRIGKQQIKLPKGVEFKFEGGAVVVKGPKGSLTQKIVSRDISVTLENGVVSFSRSNNFPSTRSLHGLYKALVANMVLGVTEGFRKRLELVGVGYRASCQGNLLDISVGYSHNIVVEIPQELKISTTQEKGSNPTILIEGIDKQLVGLIASKIREFRKPEPYQGKGILYAGEVVPRKAGKSAAKQ